MDQRDLRFQEIKKVLAELFSADQSARDQAFELLCAYFQGEDIPFIYETLSGQADPQSIYWLVRYLVEIESPLGFQKLFLLTQNQDAFIREEASRGIARISVDNQVEYLIAMLRYPWKSEVRFAAQRLGELGKVKAVIPLIQALDWQKDEEIQGFVVRALGKIGDTRALKIIEQFAEQKSGKLQESAYEALGRFAVSLDPRFIKDCFKSAYPRSREIGYLAVLKLRSVRWEKQVALGLRREQDEKLKMNVLSSVREVRTQVLFETIFYLAFCDPAAQVVMMAQSILRRLRSKKMLTWLMAKVRDHQLETKALALRMLTEYGDESSISHEFRIQYRKNQSPKIRLIVLDLLSRIYDPSNIKFLWGVACEQSAYSYAAATALVETLGPQNWDLVEKILAVKGQFHTPIIQVFLSYILRLPKDYAIPHSIAGLTQVLMKSDNIHVRYLAVRCYARSQGHELLPELIRVAGTDGEKMICRASFKEALRLARENSYELVSALRECFPTQSLFPVLMDLFQNVSAPDKNVFHAIVKEVLSFFERYRSSGNKRYRYDENQLLLLLRSQIRCGKALYIELLESPEWNDAERWILMKALNFTDLHEMENINVGFMADQYEKAPKNIKFEFLSFFKNSCARHNEKIRRTILKAVEFETDQEVRDILLEVMREWVQGSCKLGYETAIVPQ